jgi:hypothetical protein
MLHLHHGARLLHTWAHPLRRAQLAEAVAAMGVAAIGKQGCS